MSSASNIATVTAAIKDLLDNWLVQQGVASSLGDLSVTVLPPDRVPGGAEDGPQINLFLFRVVPNTSWRRSSGNADENNGRDDVLPLALDLYYLISAHGEQDFQAEILLGHVIEALHHTPVLTKDAIRASLRSSNGSGMQLLATAVAADDNGFLAGSTPLEIRPEFLSMDESSKLWSALQAKYRPSIVYRVSTVQVASHGR